MSNRAAHVLAFFTSAAILVLEILAGRLMAPYVGVSLETFTGVIGTILAGIAAGAMVGGRMSDRWSPSHLLGPTLILSGGLTALAIPIIGAIGPSMGNDPMSIVVLCSVSFLAPTAVLSAVSPMVAKLRLESLESSGKVVGSLSGAGTAGALVGTFVTGFVLVAALPSRPVVLGVAALLTITGIGLGIWSRGTPGHTPDTGLRGSTTSFGLAALALIGASSLTPDYCDVESAYSCIRIVPDPERPSGRSLYLADLRNSYVDLDDPTYLDFRYFRLAADIVEALPPGPIDALHIGGAGFTFPRWVEAVRPGSDQLVLEIDGELVDLARSELGLVTGPRLDVRIGDARPALAELADETYDVIIGDVFSGLSVPWHLTTVEVMAEIDRVLRPDGIYLANIIDGDERRFLRSELATLAVEFDHVAVIMPPDPDTTWISNHVVIASNAPLPEIQVDPADGVLWTGALVPELIDGARVLTDDFAPADQLLAKP